MSCGVYESLAKGLLNEEELLSMPENADSAPASGRHRNVPLPSQSLKNAQTRCKRPRYGDYMAAPHSPRPQPIPRTPKDLPHLTTLL
jgi:hypothetical protein